MFIRNQQSVITFFKARRKEAAPEAPDETTIWVRQLFRIDRHRKGQRLFLKSDPLLYIPSYNPDHLPWCRFRACCNALPNEFFQVWVTTDKERQ